MVNATQTPQTGAATMTNSQIRQTIAQMLKDWDALPLVEREQAVTAAAVAAKAAVAKMHPLAVGDFIDIPAWKTFGCVMAISASPLGSADSVTVLLQEHPDQPADKMRRYRLEPDEYVMAS